MQTNRHLTNKHGDATYGITEYIVARMEVAGVVHPMSQGGTNERNIKTSARTTDG